VGSAERRSAWRAVRGACGCGCGCGCGCVCLWAWARRAGGRSYRQRLPLLPSQGSGVRSPVSPPRLVHGPLPALQPSGHDPSVHRSSRYNKLSAVDRPSSIGDGRCVFDHGLPGFRTSPTLSASRVKRDTRTGLPNHRPSVPVPLHPPPSPSMRPAAMDARTLAVIRSNLRQF
jgi:hypothetical protein